MEKNEKFKALAELIDKYIVSGYKLFKTNYIAFDILNDSSDYSSHYTSEDREAFDAYYKAKISELFGDRSEIEEIMLSIYANPVINRNRIGIDFL